MTQISEFLHSTPSDTEWANWRNAAVVELMEAGVPVERAVHLLSSAHWAGWGMGYEAGHLTAVQSGL